MNLQHENPPFTADIGVNVVALNFKSTFIMPAYHLVVKIIKRPNLSLAVFH